MTTMHRIALIHALRDSLAHRPGRDLCHGVDAARHDEIVAKAAATLEDVDALVLCQFSLARAAKAIASVSGRKVFTTPASAVAKLRQLIEVPSLPARP
ncbi:MAG: arylsulfatase [Rhizobacter sp.]|nr:arylsulfatase [Rhizobacter sp.]